MLSGTPARQRSRLSQSRAPSSAPRATPRVGPESELPPYQPPEAPLTGDAQRKIVALLQSGQIRHLKTHLAHASEKLTDAAGEVNERLCDSRIRFEKNKERRQHGEATETAEQNNESEEYRQLGEQETRVNNITGRLEEKIRMIIDSETQWEGLTNAVSSIEKEEAEAQATALGTRQTRGRRRRQRNDEEEPGEDEEDQDYEGTPEREVRERNATNPPSRRLDNSLQEGRDKWNKMSLTERYASHNFYTGFYRMVHESKHPGDEIPPIPPASTWFAHMEDPHTQRADRASGPGRTSRRRPREPSPADSDDIAIERERISLKCPLTLLPFRDPVTSTKCPHSFEREAITNMISRGTYHSVPQASGHGSRRARAVKCPVCSILLSADDLRTDPVLARRVRRAEEQLARAAEDEQLESTQRPNAGGIMLGSDAVEEDAMDVDAAESDTETRIKSEPVHDVDGTSTSGSEESGESEDAEDAEDE
ncbi:hypothetical protein N7492_005820 [Penicillium capsulatum]|uniref:SP-RING-type domain-containing protein n=1 Tax=Penicillium capsulatum TaxID=69766 RepID=A0A9W9IE27_9EURO|nr:hypothetical protein N7492_005820 [Penicillium capsulatum]KAJ6135080.1 hypothetical protein N7512_000240 [Penicillium capsulatum]